MKKQNARIGKKATPKKQTALAVTSNFAEQAQTMDFDQFYNLDEEVIKKEMKFSDDRTAKQVQLLARVNACTVALSKTRTELLKSFTDPQKDSVEVKIRVKHLEYELDVATEIYAQLFPNEKNPIGEK